MTERRVNGTVWTAERVKRLRQRMQLTQEEFAQIVGAVVSTVNRWENGRKTPSRLACVSMARLEAERDGEWR